MSEFITKEEFLERFKAEFMRLAADRANEAESCLSKYGHKASEEYFASDFQREVGPEVCAESYHFFWEFFLWQKKEPISPNGSGVMGKST